MNFLNMVAEYIADELIEEGVTDLDEQDFWFSCDFKNRFYTASLMRGLAENIQQRVKIRIKEHLANGKPLYKQAFGVDYDIGIKLPSRWTDISYKNDLAPSFVAILPGWRYIKLWAMDEPKDNHTRYAFCECSGPDDGYVDQRVLLESNDNGTVKYVVTDPNMLSVLINSGRT